MTADELTAAIEAALDAAPLGEASARKEGHRTEWPYVPVVQQPADASGYRRRSQIKGLAYATRAEAVAAAQRHIDADRARLAAQLAQPRFRALREHYGLPRELPA